jgi:hypothetical protein
METCDIHTPNNLCSHKEFVGTQIIWGWGKSVLGIFEMEDPGKYGRLATAQRLRCLREVAGYKSAADFARKLGIKSSRYWNFENGSPLSLEVARLIVRTVRGTSLDWLYNGEERGLDSDLRKRLAAEIARTVRAVGRSA